MSRVTDTTEAVPAWKDTLAKSEADRVKGAAFSTKARQSLWTGAQQGINAWLPESGTDVSAEGFAAEVQVALGGKHRKGDASKIKTVALAVKHNGLSLASHKSLAAAYKTALTLTKVASQNAAEDEAADKAAQEAAKNAPSSTTTPEGAALMLAGLGVDEVARLLLDALGVDNEPAHRSLLRAISQEIAGRVKPKASAAPKAGPKAGAKQAVKAAPAQAVVQQGASKVKQAAAPVAAAQKPVVVQRTKGRATPVKQKVNA